MSREFKPIGILMNRLKKDTKRLTILVTTMILIILIVTSLFLYLNSNLNFSRKTQSITIGNLPLESSALLYVADKQGFFRQNGLNVTITDFETGITAVNALLDGRVDIAGSSEYALVRMAFQNQKIETIAVINKSELHNLVARKDHGIENIPDLKGKKIALPQGTISEFYLARFLTLNGLNSSDVTCVNMTLAKSIEALMNGDIDALINWQPFSNSVKDILGSNAILWALQSNQQSLGILTCRNAWIENNPQVVNNFLKAIAQTEKFVYTNPEQAKTIVKQQMNLTDSYIETVWAENQFTVSLDQTLLVAMEAEARWMIANNLTDSSVVPNFLDYIYINGLLSVNPDSVNIIH